MANFSLNNTNVTVFDEEHLCHLFEGGDTWKCKLVLYTKWIASILSILGSLFVLFLIVVFNKYRDPSQRMIAHLSFSCVLFSIYMFLNDIVDVNTTKCRIQGFLINVGFWHICLWTLTIMTNMYLKVVFCIDITNFEKAITVFCWVFPWPICSLAFIDDAYGPAGVWCWVKNIWEWRFGTWYVVRILSVLIIIAATIHINVIMYNLRRNRSSAVRMLDNFKNDIKTLRAYPVVYFIFNVFPIVNRIQNAVKSTPDQEGYIFALLWLQSMSDPLFGGAICITYVLDTRTRSSLTRKHFEEAFQRWKKKRASIKEYSFSSTSKNAQVKPQTLPD